MALEDNGAIQVEEADPNKPSPPITALVGPIKAWWGKDADGREIWGNAQHCAYVAWRDAVEAFLIKAGCLVYAPYRAIKGSWHERAQRINDTAIRESDAIVDLTPPGIIADGTVAENLYAESNGVVIIKCPPGTDLNIVRDRLFAAKQARDAREFIV